MKRVLIVHPNPEVAKFLTAQLKAADELMEIVVATTALAAQKAYEAQEFDGMIIASAIKQYGDGLAWARECVHSVETPFAGKIVGIACQDFPMQEAWTRLGCDWVPSSTMAGQCLAQQLQDVA